MLEPHGTCREILFDIPEIYIFRQRSQLPRLEFQKSGENLRQVIRWGGIRNNSRSCCGP
ncbi:hypothetical protein CA13_01840 [Planctomycetes bacterium CA13]|uniref:Uncharacterized protein n=1 Tax=Novipirellula herctigrandis TaxID=2527986 RepID=A0A5C5YW75_9BACT|nr:hypothetical protein CA13_01840 [Planctomycetes bacterium CA13]